MHKIIEKKQQGERAKGACFCRNFQEDTVALGTHLTVLDYLGTRKGADVWEQKWRLIKSANQPNQQGFGDILSSCLKGQEKNSLTAADYLANPVGLKPGAIMRCLETSLDTKLREMRPYLDKLSVCARPQNVRKQDKNIFERPGENSFLEEIERSIEKAAGKYNLSSDLIRGVIKAESDFQVRAESSAGAKGLMQLMPATAKELGVKDPYDIDQNIDGGTRYLRKMLDRFGSDLKKALAAYNAGPGTVKKYDGKVPYKETKQYVDRVFEYAGLNV